MDRIMVATDGSEGADRAVDFAAGLAGQSGTRLLIANVIGNQALPDDVLRQFTREQHAWIRDFFAAQSSGILQRARERARARGVTAVQLDSRHGDVVQTLLDVAGEAGADAIVVGKRGAGRLSGLLLGSVSQKLVSLATRVVIVVP